MDKLKKIGVVAIAGVSPFALLSAESFRWDLGASYLTGDTDIEDIEFQEDNASLNGRFFFKPIDRDRRSLREAPFLQRASWIDLGIDVEELDDDVGDAIDSDAYEIHTKLVEPETGWYLGLGYINSDGEMENEGPPGSGPLNFLPEYDGYSVSLGKYIFRNTALQATYTELDYGENFFGFTDSSSDTVGLGVKHFGNIVESVAYSIEANYHFLDLQVAEFDDLEDNPFDDSGEVFSVTGAIYPTEKLGLGLTYADSNDLHGAPYLTSTSEIYDGLGVFVDWFVTERWSLRALYKNSEYDLADADNIEEPGEVESDSVLFGVNVRL